MKELFDCIIIGGGPAGLQAALFLSRAQVSTLVLGDPLKSDLAYGKEVGNVFGLDGEIPGTVLLRRSMEAVKRYGGELLGEEVIHMEQGKDGLLTVETDHKRRFHAAHVIIATGAAQEKAGIRREEEFFGKGIHTCVACDGIFYKGKKVAVVGAGSHAAQEAIELLDFAKEVSIFTQGSKPEWTDALDTLLKDKNVKVRKHRITAILGDDLITGVVLADNREEEMDGIFVAIGSASSMTFANKIGIIQSDGFLSVDLDGRTNVKGVWAAGASTGGNSQVATSMGEGCNAAIDIIRMVKGLSDYTDQT